LAGSEEPAGSSVTPAAESTTAGGSQPVTSPAEGKKHFTYII